MKGDEYQSKISFFMSIIEGYLRDNNKDKLLEQFRVGFVFFNESIYVLKGAVQKSIPVYVSSQ